MAIINSLKKANSKTATRKVINFGLAQLPVCLPPLPLPPWFACFPLTNTGLESSSVESSNITWRSRRAGNGSVGAPTCPPPCSVAIPVVILFVVRVVLVVIVVVATANCGGRGLGQQGGKEEGGEGERGTGLGFVKSFCALLKNWNAASRARKFFIFVDFWLRVLTNNKVAQLPFVFQFCTFLCPSSLPLFLFPFCVELKFQWVSGFLSHCRPSHSSPAPRAENIFCFSCATFMAIFPPLLLLPPFTTRDVFNNLISFVNLPDRFNLIETKLFNFDFRLFNGLHRHAALDPLKRQT